MTRPLLPDLATARDDYLQSGDDRLLPIVDAHHHYWTMANPHPWLTQLPRIPFRYGDYASICRDFLPADYARAGNPDPGQPTHRILRHVVMEGEWTPDDPVGEARWMLALTEASGEPQAMAAQIWLDRADLASVLEAYTQAPLRGFVRSVRHKPRTAPRQDYRADWAEPGSMRCPKWRQGYARLAAAGLMFELQAPWWHVDEMIELARDFPETLIIVNHAAMPGTRDADTLRDWRAAIKRLSACANVVMKISGIGVKDERWSLARQAPVVHALIDDFGFQRCLFASNFPVDSLVVSLDQLWSGFKTLTEALSREQRLALFCDNAVRIYGLS